MTEINYIRQQVNGKGHTYAEVARRTNRDQRTVQKYADLDEFQPELKGRKHQPSPVMDPVKDIVDQWLREDLKKKKKYRRTAKRIWELCHPSSESIKQVFLQLIHGRGYVYRAFYTCFITRRWR